LRQFFLAIPRDLEDAARLEGAGEWTVFRRVVLPLSGPALGTLVVLALADQWKSFFWPLVATSSPNMEVLEVGIARLHGPYDLNWPFQMAAATVAVIPMLVLYIVAQKYFIRGIEVAVPKR
jgi:multiple sugar transport system permease protein